MMVDGTDREMWKLAEGGDILDIASGTFPRDIDD